MNLHHSIQIHSAKQVGEGIFGFIDLLELELALQEGNLDFKKAQIFLARIETLGRLGVLLGSAEMNESFLSHTRVT